MNYNGSRNKYTYFVNGRNVKTLRNAAIMTGASANYINVCLSKGRNKIKGFEVERKEI